MISVLIVSDIRLYREGLAEILDRDTSLSVSGIAHTINHVIKEICLNSPDVVLLDMTMIASCEVIDGIISSYPSTKLVALAVTEDEDTILACAKAGIAGYVSREASIEQLVNTVCGVVEGELYCPRRIAASLFHKLKSPHNLSDTSHTPTVQHSANKKMVTLLTQREKQIAEQLTNGLSNKQIARNLSIELSTVKNHVHNILVKMGVGSRMQAASMLLHNRTT